MTCFTPSVPVFKLPVDGVRWCFCSWLHD